MSSEKYFREFGSDLNFSYLSPEDKYILVVEPKTGDRLGDWLIRWAASNPNMIDEFLLNHGGILFRSFHASVDQFKNFADRLYPENESTNYKGGVVPQPMVAEGIYLASLHPSQMTIRQHHELANHRKSPSKVFFYCETPADQGGYTPLCSNRKFMRLVDRKIIEKFKEKKVLYRRCLKRKSVTGVLGWEKSYETTKKSEVESYLKSQSYDFEWEQDDTLIITHVGPAVAVHPSTGEELWYNYSFNTNMSSGIQGKLNTCFMKAIGNFLAPESLSKLLELPVKYLPNDTLFGDGKYIEPSTLEEIGDFYEKHKVLFEWRKGDFVVIDNILTSHGRTSYVGEQRRVLATWKFSHKSKRATAA